MHNTVDYATVNTGQQNRAGRGVPAFAGVGRMWWPAGDGPCYHRSTTGYREPPMTRARHPGRPPPTYRGCAKTWVLVVLVLGVWVMMLLYCANRLLGEPVLVSGSELVVVVSA